MIHFITMKLYRLIFAIAFISLLVPGCKNSAPYLFKNEIDSIKDKKHTEIVDTGSLFLYQMSSLGKGNNRIIKK